MISGGLFSSLRAQVPAQVVDELAALLALVEQELSFQTQSAVQTVESIGGATLKAGGKRLRPALVLLSALATGRPFNHERAVKISASIEMVHMATLVHDDVIDEARTRRGHPTAASLFGNTAAILGGDVLLARAMRLLAQDGDLRIIRAVSNAVVELAEGEVWELEVRGDFDLTEAVHRDVLKKKTAALVSCACRVGALLADALESEEDGLTAFGSHLGIAFQVVDDILDFDGDQGKTGKPWATDFRDGQATLPLIYLRDSLDTNQSLFTRTRFGNGVTDDDLREICTWMRASGAYDRAMSAAKAETCAAVDKLSILPESPYGDLLRSVARFVAEREA